MTRRQKTLAVLAAIALAGGLAWSYAGRWVTAPAATAGRAPANPVVPVVAGIVAQQDVPVYVNGLGSVTAFNTATIKPQVDGKLIQVNFREGQEVKAGDVLAQIDPRPFEAALRQAEAVRQRDQALLANARLDLARFQDLGKREYASRQSVDTQLAQVAQLEAAVAADTAQIDTAKVQLDYTTIRSPIGGRTGIRLVDSGNVVHVVDTGGLVIVTQLQPISVIFTVPADALPQIAAASASGELKALAFSRDNQTKLADGVLSVIDNMIDQTTGTIKLKATFANEQRALWPGQFVNARLLVRTRRAGVTVPAAVVQRGPQGTFAYVINADATVEMRKVVVEQIDDGVALIASGLAPGERIVVDGQYRLQPGTKVKPVAAGKPPAAGEDKDGASASGAAAPS